MPNKIIRSNRTNLVLKMNKVPMTERKNDKNLNNKLEQNE